MLIEILYDEGFGMASAEWNVTEQEWVKDIWEQAEKVEGAQTHPLEFRALGQLLK